MSDLPTGNELFFVVRRPQYEGSISTVMGLYENEEDAAADIVTRNQADPASSGLYVAFGMLRNEAIPIWRSLPLAADSYNALQVTISGVATLEAAAGTSGIPQHSYAQWNMVAPMDCSGIEVHAKGFFTQYQALGSGVINCEIQQMPVGYPMSAWPISSGLYRGIPIPIYPFVMYDIFQTVQVCLAKNESFTLKITRHDDEDDLPGSIFLADATYRFIPYAQEVG